MDTEEKLRALAEQVTKDPDFLVRLYEDPEGTARAAGLSFALTGEELKELLGLAESSELPIVEILEARQSKAGFFGGGGGGSW